ncbi:MAG: nuclear transport factor 2 family protein [Piscinibacter sp.]|nr:nuclear transport factor 2 family protein [Piscinibacter sp.]
MSDRIAPLALWAALSAALQPAQAAPPDDLRAQVEATERAFARSMAQRDHAAFVALLSEQAVFYAPNRVLRGRAEVAAAWKAFFDGPAAPFSWEPDQVDVLADGTLAHSSGPVRDPDGRLVARFNSVWRQEAPGVWRIVFDKGSPLSEQDRAREAQRASGAASAARQ